MKNVNPYLLFTFIAVLAFSCSKFKESPDPAVKPTTTTGGGGGGLVEGGPFQGLWKLSSKTEDGNAVTLDGYYTVKLQGGGICELTYYNADNSVDTSINTTYTIDAGTPQQIHFITTRDNIGTDRTIKKKYTTQIVWEYGSAPIVEETLIKQ